jgi:hypothetical protein
MLKSGDFLAKRELSLSSEGRNSIDSLNESEEFLNVYDAAS